MSRITIRKMTLEDAPFYLRLLNEPCWIENIGDRNVHSIEDAENYIRNGTFKSYEQHGFGSYLVSLNETGQPIGVCGLYKREYLLHPDLGFAFLPEFHGKGLAFEASVAVIKMCVPVFNIKQLAAIVKPQNMSSLKLLERLGFERKGEVKVNDTGLLDAYLELCHDKIKVYLGE